MFYPTAEEMRAAQLACCGNCCDRCENPVEYVRRARSMEMSELLDTAIEEELSETEKRTLHLFWFENLNVSEIAARLDVNPSTVNRTLERVKEKLYRVLRFVVKYQQKMENPAVVWEELRRAAVLSAVRENRGCDFPQRLRALRSSENLSRNRLAKGLGMSETRLTSLEFAKAKPSVDEIIGIAAFFGVTTDYLIV